MKYYQGRNFQLGLGESSDWLLRLIFRHALYVQQNLTKECVHAQAASRDTDIADESALFQSLEFALSRLVHGSRQCRTKDFPLLAMQEAFLSLKYSSHLLADIQRVATVQAGNLEDHGIAPCFSINTLSKVRGMVCFCILYEGKGSHPWILAQEFKHFNYYSVSAQAVLDFLVKNRAHEHPNWDADLNIIECVIATDDSTISSQSQLNSMRSALLGTSESPDFYNFPILTFAQSEKCFERILSQRHRFDSTSLFLLLIPMFSRAAIPTVTWYTQRLLTSL